ncbi:MULTISPECIES: LysR family transcriptional regulator [unclassified Ensifer]|uniref:LysR family transcriptional regulator n=1 Tax=unclassified Ensifer TaxID=2633371 RepID=UPI00070FB864|nr:MULTISPECIES: LysR family transcriptional regulator [unclassified Ensifer]KQW58993.1 LysR family transcriptional regulator [Ensifer sp. Root1252]KRC67829.1 LysR family transcriptional regulator [Ensifer sp. Root231]KRC98905.1 LysR family transcriptional regulator [Ensifer sp. Root258]
MSKIEPSWDYYRTFLKVLKEGSLSAAARELGLTQPTVGRHVDAMEEMLGFPLFTRSPQGLLPTDAARALQPYAEALAATSAALLRAASGQQDTVSGTVRISASEVIGIEVLPPILAELHVQYPDLTIELSASDAIEDILRQEADIAVRMAVPSQDALVALHIGAVPLGFHAHRRYLDRRGTPATIADLSRHSLIGYDRETAAIRAIIARTPGLPDVRFALKADSNLAQLAAIRAGFGIGICQNALAARDPDILPVLADGFVMKLETWLVMHENLKAAPRCRVVFDALAKGLRTYIRPPEIMAAQ